MSLLDALDDGVNGILAVLGSIAIGVVGLAFIVSLVTQDPGPAVEAAVRYEVDVATEAAQTLAWLVGAFGALGGLAVFVLGLARGWWELPR